MRTMLFSCPSSRAPLGPCRKQELAQCWDCGCCRLAERSIGDRLSSLMSLMSLLMKLYIYLYLFIFRRRPGFASCAKTKHSSRSSRFRARY